MQSVGLDDLREEAERRLEENGENGNGPDGSPELGLADGTELENRQTVIISLTGTEHPFSFTIKVLNAEEYTAEITWNVNTFEHQGVEFIVNPAASGSPFIAPGNYLLTIIAFRTDSGVPQSAFLTIRVVN